MKQHPTFCPADLERVLYSNFSPSAGADHVSGAEQNNKSEPPQSLTVGFQLNRANAKSLGDRPSACANSSPELGTVNRLLTPLRICPWVPVRAERSSLRRGLAAGLNGRGAGLLRCLILFSKLVLLRACSMCVSNSINKADRQADSLQILGLSTSSPF